ncbi:hypothetical protein MAMC_01986 [Methylacidimicrobium cyclopophantes]|uniref:Outer membrane protein beta-barrel domain-containing protein n=1 Tax=Methylacidimicrobium cyclopophantes TaxID=1041766 RepID=A0A5E6MFS8_9BACT|nr:hypothetical protein [Methylacidimicrobium cyclopophantes]VVM08120.1 hypothetical protein MAMC_01986 [Methylacidimicrobium cyclopophantes]
MTNRLPALSLFGHLFAAASLFATPLVLPEDGVLVPHAPPDPKPQAALLSAGMRAASKHSSGSWYLSIGMGTGFPQYNDGEVVNDRTGAIEPFKADTSFAFTSLLSTGYRWFDPERWGHWCFDIDFVGAYLGSGHGAPNESSAINLGFLGLRGRLGYRILEDRVEPFVGFAGGGVVVNTESASVNHGEVWGYWFAPGCGLRYYIPRSRWSVTVEGLFRFVGGVNGLSAPGATINETPHAGLDGHWIYVPVGVVALGYRF